MAQIDRPNEVQASSEDPYLEDPDMVKKPVTADEKMEIAIGESDTVEYTVDSDNSPYLEVRANVPNTDDTSLPVNTLRMWFLGVVFTLVSAPPPGINASESTEDSHWLCCPPGRNGSQPVLLHALSKCDHYFASCAVSQLSNWMLPRKDASFEECLYLWMEICP